MTFADGTDSNKFTYSLVSPETEMIRYPVLEGRWLQPGDQNVIVLNHMLVSELEEQGVAGEVKVGEDITLDLNGKRSTWHVAGIVREMMAPPRAYVNYSYFVGITGKAGLANAAVVALTGENDTSTDSITKLLAMHGMAGPAKTDTSGKIMPQVEQKLDSAAMNVSTIASIGDMRLRMKEHLAVIAAFITFIAGLTVVVGGLGLASTMSINLVERRRELGVMRAIGAIGPYDLAADHRRIAGHRLAELGNSSRARPAARAWSSDRSSGRSSSRARWTSRSPTRE